MPFSLTPRWVFQHYSEITPDWLRQQGITLLLSDLDFTLAAKKTRRPDQSLRDWIAALRNAGTVSYTHLDSEEKAVVDAALAVEKVRKATEGMQIIKTILVKNRLVNLIVKPAK